MMAKHVIILKSILIMLFLVLGKGQTCAQSVAVDDIEQLQKDMYRLARKSDSLQQFIEVTNRLIELSKKNNNEDMLYRAWSNQASMLSAEGKREEAMAIVKEMSDYAREHDSKFGLYTATFTNAQIESGLRMEHQVEK